MRTVREAPLRPVVVDAALAVKWVLPEELSGRAQGLYEAAVRGGRPVVGPSILPVEVINVIYQRRRKDDITAAEAHAALDLFFASGSSPSRCRIFTGRRRRSLSPTASSTSTMPTTPCSPACSKPSCGPPIAPSSRASAPPLLGSAGSETSLAGRRDA